MNNPAIAAAAHALATATGQHDRAREALVKAEAGRSQAVARIDKLEEERRAIATRRQAGKGKDDDGGRLELIRLDLEDLAGLLREEAAKVTAAMQPVTAAAAAMQAAQSYLLHLEYETTEAMLIENVAKLDELLLASLVELETLRAPLGRGKPVWCPSVPLLKEVRRLAAAAGRL
jgi:hypothetical protein